MKAGWRALAAVALGLAGTAFWLGRESAPPPAARSPEGAVKADSPVDIGPSTAPAIRRRAVASDAPAVASHPLPPAGTPLAAIHDELAGRARAGDVAAACRLGVELTRCRAQRRMAAFSKVMRKSLEARVERVPDTAVDALARLQESTEVSDGVCDGVNEQQMNEAIGFQRLAAERGDERMRLWYASAPALDRENFLADLDEWSRYRALAPGYLQEALEAGDPSAPAVLQKVHLPRGPWALSSDVPLRLPDEHLYFVYRELSDMLHPPPANPPPSPPGAIDPAPQPGPGTDMAAVRAEAEQLRQEYYADYLPASDEGASATPADRNDPATVCGE